MKKKLLTLLAAFGIVGVLAPATVLAAPAPTTTKTVISGVVTDSSKGGKPVRHARVTVVCNNHAKTTTTDKNGAYSVTFKPGQCGVGSKVTVVATKSGSGGVSTSTVTAGTIKLNVAIVNVSLPEFGIITGFAGGAAAVAAFFVIRRRQVEQN